jgi:uncharacterized MAPEG superfamily protein
MTTPLWCLVIVALLPIVLSFVGGALRTRQFEHFDNKNPRRQQAQMEGVGARVYAAQANAWEQLGFFTAAIAVLQLANPQAAAGATAANLSLAFLATRLVHPVLYAANLDALRSLVFVIGLGCGIGLFWIAA